MTVEDKSVERVAATSWAESQFRTKNVGIHLHVKAYVKEFDVLHDKSGPSCR